MDDFILRSSALFDGSSYSNGSFLLHIRKGYIAGLYLHGQLLPPEASTAEQIDCGDRLLMPGFCDSHLHGLLGSLQSVSADLLDSRSEQDAAERLYAFSGGNDDPEQGWLFGFGWNHFNWKPESLPSKDSLDRYFSCRPVCMFNEEMHSLWVNSKALEICGIHRNTPDPGNGRIFRDGSGEPSGYFLEPDAMKPVMDTALALPGGRKTELYRRLLSEAAGLGITAFSDIQIFDTMDCGVYEDLLKDGGLSCRVFPVFPMDTEIEELGRLRESYSGEKLCFSGVKEFIDGTAPMYTAVLNEPYADRPGFNAEPLIDPGLTADRAAELDLRGFRIRFHACGAGAVRIGLDIFEEVRRRNGDSGIRHTIEHIENIAEEDIPRFRKLGVIASVQPDHIWAETFAGHPFHRLLGEKRCRWAWPFRSIIESGAETAFGTDYPVSPLSPMNGVWRAVTRLHDDLQPEGGWIPQEKLSVLQALTHYTAGSAYQMGMENEFGRLLPGMKADIAVIDGDPFRMEPKMLRDTGIHMTVCDGEISYGPA